MIRLKSTPEKESVDIIESAKYILEVYFN